MTTIAKLSVALVGRTAAFQKAFMSAGQTLKNFAGPALRVGKVLGAIGAAAGLAAAAGLTALTIQQLNAADAIAKTSDRLGIQTEKLAGLQLAANLAGASNEDLEKGIAKMLKSIGDAEKGTGAQADALARLGLTVEELKRMSPDEQFRLIGERLNALPSQADRVTAAFDLFGRSGVTLLNTLQAGAGAFEDAQQKAELFGLALDRADVSKIEAANDRVSELRELFNGLARQIAVQVAPFIAAGAQAFIDWATQGKGAAGIAEQAMTAATVAAGTAANAIQAVVKAWLRMKIAALEAREGLEGLWKDPRELLELNRQIQKLERELEGLEGQDWGANVVNAMNAIQDAAQETADQIAATSENMRTFDEDADAALEAAEAHADALRTMESAAERVFNATRTPMEKYQQAIDELNKLLEQNLIDFETHGRAVQQARDALESATATEPAKTASFRQVQLERMALGGTPGATSKPAKVEDPQLKVTNDHLASIDRNIRDGQTARLG
jgi:hypothetical protein